MSNDPWAAFPVVPNQAPADPWAAFPAVPTAPAEPSTARQIGTNLGAAAVRGLSNFVGLPGDVNSAMERGAQWVGRQFGVDLTRPAAPPEWAGLDRVRLPTSDDVRGAARGVGLPVDQVAQTPGGRNVQDTIEGALSLPISPMSIAMGGLAGGAGSIAAEAVRDAGWGQTGQTVARVAAGLAAPMAAGSVVNRAVRARVAPPSTEQLRDASTAAYNAAHSAGVVVPAPKIGQLANDMATGLRNEGFNPRIHPRAAAVLGEVESVVNMRSPQSLRELDNLRRQARAVAASPEPDERRIGVLMIQQIDDWIDGLRPADVTAGAGNVREATQSLTEARSLWSRARKGETIEDLIESARLRASQFSGSGLENALRTEFRNFADNPKRMRGFSEEERNAIRAVAFGGPTVNALRRLGKLAPTSPLGGGIGAAGGAAIGGSLAGPIGSFVGGVGVPMAGGLARLGATSMTAQNARTAAETARAGQAVVDPGVNAIARTIAILEAERAAGRGGQVQPEPR